MNATTETKVKRWSPTKWTNIIRANATGCYFLNATVGGKRYLFSLETTDGLEAQKNRDNELKIIRDAQAKGIEGNGKLTVREGVDLLLADLKERGEMDGRSQRGLRPKSVVFYTMCVDKLAANIGPDRDKSFKRVDLEDVVRWVRPIQRDASASLYNGVTVMVRELFGIAIRKCACRVNLGEGLEHVAPQRKELNLPTRDQWEQLIQRIVDGPDGETAAKKAVLRVMVRDYRANVEINYKAALAAHPEWLTVLFPNGQTAAEWHKVYDLTHYVSREETESRNQESADLVVFLTMTGARIGETRALTVDKIDRERMQITFGRASVKGQTRSKTVPINPALLPVLERCEKRATARGDRQLFGIKDCRKALQSACKDLGFPRWTHHDFRHLLATTALEAGMTAPEVGALLGHSEKDNGRTVMATYAHVNASRLARAANLQFGNKPAEPVRANDI